MKHDGKALGHASPELRNDRDVVLAAVSKHGRSRRGWGSGGESRIGGGEGLKLKNESKFSRKLDTYPCTHDEHSIEIAKFRNVFKKEITLIKS